MYDFTGAAKRFGGRRWRDVPRKFDCDQCQDKGKYSVDEPRKIAGRMVPVPQAYRCPCAAGLNVSASIPYRPGTAPPPQLEEPTEEARPDAGQDVAKGARSVKRASKPTETPPQTPAALVPGVSDSDSQEDPGPLLAVDMTDDLMRDE